MAVRRRLPPPPVVQVPVGTRDQRVVIGDGHGPCTPCSGRRLACCGSCPCRTRRPSRSCQISGPPNAGMGCTPVLPPGPWRGRGKFGSSLHVPVKCLKRLGQQLELRRLEHAQHGLVAVDAVPATVAVGAQGDGGPVARSTARDAALQDVMDLDGRGATQAAWQRRHASHMPLRSAHAASRVSMPISTAVALSQSRNSLNLRLPYLLVRRPSMTIPPLMPGATRTVMSCSKAAVRMSFHSSSVSHVMSPLIGHCLCLAKQVRIGHIAAFWSRLLGGSLTMTRYPSGAVRTASIAR